MDLFKQLQQDFLTYLHAQAWDQSPSELYEPVGYILHLGGKRLRPVLTLLAYRLYRDDMTAALPVAMAVEIFHNFSLVHDDIMDDAPLRRGKPTVHVKYDVDTGILSGDLMLIYAYDYLSKINNPERFQQMMHVFNKVAIKVCEGQQYDMNFEKRSDVTIDQYLQMIQYKTAALIAGSLSLGGIAAGAPHKEIHHLEGFGENIGIAFQLQDDYLDTFGDPAKVGKKIGGDIMQNKKTFLILKALELADASTRKRLQDLMQNQDEQEDQKIAAVINILSDLQIPKLTRDLTLHYQHLAFEHLAQLQIATDKKEALQQISLDLIGREF